MTLLLLAAAPLAVLAQETTSAIRVSVTGPDGAAAEGASVTVTDSRTGTTRSSTTGSGGNVTFSGLRVGGPYTAQVSASGAAGVSVSDIYLRLGDTYSLPIALGGATMEEVVVTAQQVQTMQLALGPASTFNLTDLEDYPAINRDIRDVIRFDPRIYQDQAFVGAIQCAGANPRFNSLTIDGTRFNDNFGLNSNGYPTERQPFPYDAIQEVAVELAPFDVQYGGFTACNINAVTKSGQNEFFGSGFFDYTDDSMKGDKLEGDTIDPGDFDEKRYGLSVGGPIIKDKLFFFAAYEKLEGVEQINRGPADSDAGDRMLGVSQAQLDEIADIARTVYGYEPGGFPKAIDVEDEKYVVKFDWEISDRQRLSYTYNYNDGFSISQSDSGSSRLSFSNHFYERGAELKAHNVQWFSDWNDRFSTEVRYSEFDLDNRQLNIGPPGFGEVQVATWNDPDGDGNFARGTVYLGVDDSRQSNKLNYETQNFKFAGRYAMGDHLFTFGYERDALDIFNLFIQETEGEFRFDRGCGPDNPNGCIDDFRNGLPDRIYYENARPNNNPNDGAAEWSYEINTLYFQDEFTTMGGDLTLVAGLRYDWYTSDDVPRENPGFEERNGYSNATNFDGMDLIQPRIGFNWLVDDRLSVRGGIGIFSGGNPNVWLSNNYSNDGATLIEIRERLLNDIYGRGNWDLFNIPLNGTTGPIWDVPQDMVDAVASGSTDGNVDAIDPDFELPSNLKLALGFTYDADLGFLGDGYTINGDFLYTKADNSAIVVRPNLVQVGTAPDGRPIYDNTRGFLNDTVLTNVQGSDAEALNLSLGINKSYENGWDWSFGYAFTDADDVSPMTSSTSGSNFGNIAVSDPNNPGLATSNYEIPHRFTFRVGYEAFWWGNNRTKFAVFASANEGRPYSHTFSRDDGDTFGDDRDFRHLLYVPNGIDDPNVTYAPGFDTDGFFAFLDSTGLSDYAGRIAPRNGFQSGWWTNVDFRFEQEFPAFHEDHKFAGYVVISNICNLINDDWCVLKEVGFPRNEGTVDMEIVDGAYLFESFDANAGDQSRSVDASLYEIRVGLRYDF